MAGIAYVFMAVTSIISGWDSFKLGYWTAQQEAYYKTDATEDEAKYPGYFHFIKVKPEKSYKDFPSTLRNEKDEAVLRARSSAVEVMLPDNYIKPENVKLFEFFDGLLMSLIIIIIIALPIQFTRFILSLKKEVIFNRSNINITRSIGIQVLLIYIFTTLHTFLQLRINQILFSFPEYTISRSSSNAAWLVVGISILLIAEILSRGLAIKKEQELTI